MFDARKYGCPEQVPMDRYPDDNGGTRHSEFSRLVTAALNTWLRHDVVIGRKVNRDVVKVTTRNDSAMRCLTGLR